MNIKEFRQQYPDYADMNDIDLSVTLHDKHYKDIPFEQFFKEFTGNNLPTPYDSTLGKIAKAPQEVAVGAAETAATLLTAPTGWMLGKVGKWVGTGVTALMGDEKPLEFGKYFEEKISSALTYIPKTEAGQGAVSLVAKPIEKFVEYARKPSELAKLLGATEEIQELTGDIAEIGAFGLAGLITRLRPLVKSKPEAFNLAKKIGESLEDIKDPIERAKFVDDIIKEARDTGRDPWDLLERGVAVVEKTPETKLPAGRGMEQPKESLAKAMPMEGEITKTREAYKAGVEEGRPSDYTELLSQESRTIKDIISDINAVMGKERGSVSGKDLSPEATEALKRLKIDYKTLEGKAKDAGLSIRQYLVNEGVDVATASLVADSSPKTIFAPKPAIGIQEFMDTSRKEAEKSSKTPIRDTFVSLIVDKHGNVKRELKKIGAKGQEAAENFELIKGARGYAGDVFQTINDSVWKGLKMGDEQWLDTIHVLRRKLAIWEYKPDYKFGEYGREQVMQYLENLKSQLGEKKFNDLWNRSDKLFELTDQHSITRLLQEGLITEQEYNNLSQYKYLPTEFLDKLDPMMEIGVGKDKVSVMSSGLQELGKGERKLMEVRTKKLIFEMVSRVEGRIASNKAARSLYETARDIPDNGLISVDKKGVADPVLLGTMIDGERYTFWMDRTLAKEWYKNDAVMNHATAEWISWLSGSKILKAFATGYNPAFILTNIPRDLGLIWLSTNEYSAHLPLVPFQMLKDMGAVFPDVIMNKGRVKDFIKEGGSFGFLTHYGKVGGETFKIGGFEGITDYLSWMGEKSELISRVALRERTINNLKEARARGENVFTDAQIAKKATAVARGYIDFSEGGALVKTLDTGIPYLNAGIQGTRAIFRGAKENPGVFTYKIAQVMALSSAIWYLNHINNQDALRSISDREKEANWIITTPYKVTDDQGQERPFYLKIAKDQGQRIFSSVAEAIMERFYEGKFPTKQVWEGMQDLVSLSPSQLIPPTIQSFLGYTQNYDFWLGDKIWKRENIKDAEQWDNRTNPLFRQVSRLGLSPAKTEYFVNRIIPLNNPLTYLFTGSYNIISGEAEKELQKKGLKQMLAENPTVKRIAGIGDPYNYHREDIKDLREETTTNSFIITRSFDEKLDTFMRDPSNDNKAEVMRFVAFISEKSPEEGQRLEGRLKRGVNLWQIPDRRWWMNTAELKPEARATVFWQEYSKASNDKRTEMLATMDKVQGYASERFLDALKKLVHGSDKKAKEQNKKNEEDLKKQNEQ